MCSNQTFGGLARLGLRGILLHETAHPWDRFLLFLAGLLNWVSLEATRRKPPEKQLIRLGVTPGFLQSQVYG